LVVDPLSPGSIGQAAAAEATVGRNVGKNLESNPLFSMSRIWEFYVLAPSTSFASPERPSVDARFALPRCCFPWFSSNPQDSRMALVAYPAILTKKDWNKKKGTIAKMAGKTGTGPLMDECEAEYAKLTPQVYTPNKYGVRLNQNDLDALQSARESAVDDWGKSLSKLTKKLNALVKKLNEVEAEWKASKVIPKKAAEHAAAVRAAAGSFATAVETSGRHEILPVFDQWKQLMEIGIDKAKNDIKGQISTLEKQMLKVLNGDKTLAEWSEHCTQAARSVFNSVNALQDLRDKYGKTWEPIADPNKFAANFKKKDTESEDMEKMIKKIQKELNKLKTEL
jgi:uncharacterized FlaG/YvyC family protein